MPALFPKKNSKQKRSNCSVSKAAPPIQTIHNMQGPVLHLPGLARPGNRERPHPHNKE